MPVSVQQFLRDLELGRERPTAPCSDCDTPLQPVLTGQHKVDGDLICEDCYFGRLGEIVERTPLGKPSSHGHSFSD